MVLRKLSILLCILFVAASAYALPTETAELKEDFLWNSAERQSYEFAELIPAYNSYINWTTGKVRSELTIPLKYTDPNIGRLLNNYASEMRESLRQNLVKALGSLRIYDIFMLKDYYSRKSDIRFEIIAKVDAAFYYPPLQKNNQYLGIVELDLYGKNGLANLFYRDIERIKPPMKYLAMNQSEDAYYDTIIVDTILFNEFQPSIGMRIYDEDGNLLYGPETVDRTTLEEIGVCEFTSSLSYAFRSTRCGKNIFYIIPSAITGKMNTDIVINNEDAARLLGNAKSWDYLNQSKVIVVKPVREEE